MLDFSFLPSDFNATEITVVANTPNGRQYLADRYGAACISFNVRKSTAPDVADKLEIAGFTYS